MSPSVPGLGTVRVKKMRPRNVILTDYGTAGWGVTSGSDPELVGGASTLDELLASYPDSIVYVQRYVRVGQEDGHLVAVRLRYDAHREERDVLAERIAATLDQNLDLMALDAFGDRLVVVALSDDRFGDISDALDPAQPATVVFPGSDGSVRAVTSVVRSDAHDHESVREFARLHRSDDRVERLITA